MNIKQFYWQKDHWNIDVTKEFDSDNTVVFVFFSPEFDPLPGVEKLRKILPRSKIIGCSGAGEIANTDLLDQSAVVTVVKFEKCTVKTYQVPIANAQHSFSAGVAISKALNAPDLRLIYVLSEGLHVNGTDLVGGIASEVPHGIAIAGGLAGDGQNFKQTRTLWNDQCASNTIAVVGIYGNALKVGVNAGTGWLPFGPMRTVTKSTGNVLYELDHKPALEIYREFLGEAAKKLPSSALMFPLTIGVNKPGEQQSRNIVRTILAVDNDSQSMTFAGDIPQNETARFMRVNESSLVGAARDCAAGCQKSIDPNIPALSLMVSCVGRRIVLGSSTEDEIEGVYETLPDNSVQTGFYSYGEIGPGRNGSSDLHNQTVTLTWLQEV